MSPFQPTVHNLLKHKHLTTFSADRHIYVSFCARYFATAYSQTTIKELLLIVSKWEYSIISPVFQVPLRFFQSFFVSLPTKIFIHVYGKQR